MIAEHGEESGTPYVSEKHTQLSEKPLDVIIESLSIGRDSMLKAIMALCVRQGIYTLRMVS